MPVSIQGIDGTSPPTFLSIDGSANDFVTVRGLLVLSGTYPTGGDVLDLTTMKIPGSSSCVSFLAWSIGGNLNTQYVGIGAPSTALSAWKLKTAGTTIGTETSAGAYPAGITGDTIAFEAVFTKNR